MNITRSGRLAGIAIFGMLALAACGSDNNTSSGGSSSSPTTGGSSIDCKSGTLKASGSSAQKNAMTQWVTDYQTACTGATINYSPAAPGRRPGLHQQPDGLRRVGLGAQGHRAPDGRRALQDRQGHRHPHGRRSDRRGLQRQGLPKLVLTPGVIAQDLQRQDHQVERPGHRRAQLRRDAAGHDDRGLPPVRLVRYDRQLHQVPRHRGRVRLDVRARQGLAEGDHQRSGRQGLRRRGRSAQGPGRLDRLRRVLVHDGRVARRRAGRQRRRRRSPSRRRARQGCRGGQGHRYGRRPDAEASTTRPRRPGPTRSCW